MAYLQDISTNIHSPLKWKNIEVGNGYFVSFEIINNTILHTIPVGNVENFDIDKYYTIRGKIIEEYFGPHKQYIEIKNYGRIKGIPNRAMRIAQVKYFWLDIGKCLAFAGYNTSLLMRTVFRTGLRLNKSPFPINVFKHKEEAIKFVKKYVNKTEQGTGWTYMNNNTDSKFEIRVLPSNTLLIKYDGIGKTEDVRSVEKILEKIFKEGYIQGPHYIRVNDYSNLKGGSNKARNFYISSVKKIHKKYNCHPKRNYIIGAKGIVKASILLAKSLFKYNFIYADSLEEVLRMEKINAIKQDIIHFTISNNDIEKLVENIGSIAWANKPATFNDIEESHPFFIVYEALELIKNDFDSLMKEAKEREQKLENAKKELENANNMKNDFLANITHEIRTPLNTIIGFASLLQKYNIDHKHDRYLQFIMQSSNSLLGMLNDILDVAKLESDKIKISESLCSLETLIKEVIEYHDINTNKNNLPINFHSESDFPKFILMDSIRLRQVLMNIVGNAVKFTLEGKIDIFLHFTEIKASKINIQIIVKDTGIGIDEKNLEEIFMLFSNKKNADKKFGGTGLGLAIAQKLTSKLGGKIFVESVIGKGSTFIIEIKNISVVDDNFMSNNVDPQIIENIKKKLQHTDTAVVEISNNHSSYINSILNKFGGKAVFFKYSNNSINELVEFKPAFIFISMETPVMNNYSLIKEIKSKKILSNIPLIAITNNVEINTEKAISFLGCSQVISSPLNPQEIIMVLSNEFDNQNEKAKKSSGDNV